MSRLALVLSSLSLILIPACKSSNDQTREAAEVNETSAMASTTPESQPSEDGSAAESQPASPIAAMGPTLAIDVWKAAGGESWDEVKQLKFDFVVEAGGERVFVAGHTWDRVAKTDRVEWTGKDGKARVITVSLDDRSAMGTVDGVEISGEQAKQLGEEAHARWVNDSYWLVKQLKVLDAGVTTEDSGTREVNGKSVRVLELSFDGVGLTPGDRYWLFYDEGTKRVIGWEMKLQGSEGEPVMVSWEGHEKFGPLELATSHTMPGGKRRILLENVEVR